MRWPRPRGRSPLGARGTLDAHETASIGRIRVRGWGEPGSVSVGAGSAIEDDVLIQLSNGGRIIIGDGVRVRTSAVLNVSGTLELRGDNLVSWNCVIHCGSSVVFEQMAGTGEGVTVVDGTHFHGPVGGPDEHWYHNNRLAPVVIGRNTWLASKCTVGAGVTLGARTTVAAHSFVRAGDYEDGIVLAGSPARRVDG